MEWRLKSREEWRAGRGDANHEAMRRHIDDGNVPGVMAYEAGKPVGWCSVSPRPGLVGLEAPGRYRNFADPSAWVVLCFYVPEAQRGRGMMLRLLEAAKAHAREGGARVLEGYPPEAAFAGDGAGGTIEIFKKAGFVEAARVGEQSAVMRYYFDAAG
jgi:GNAT superfamily N-acetyltransferase